MASPASPMNRRRSERVMLQMKVTVIAEDVTRRQVREEATTMVVNAHGGLMQMNWKIHQGQSFLLLNPKTATVQGCRVVRVDERANEYYSVAFEFDQPNPKFWPIVFPPKDWEAQLV